MPTLHILICRNSVFVDTLIVENDHAVIGRDSQCAVRLPEENVSRKHALLRHHEWRWWLRDLGSLNGTVVNGRLIRDDAEILEGAEVDVASFRLKVFFSAQRAAKAAEDINSSTRSRAPAATQVPVCLTPAQRNVHTLLLDGLLEKQVAARLGISVNTVHDRVKEIYKRLGVSSRAELLLHGLNNGGIDKTST